MPESLFVVGGGSGKEEQQTSCPGRVGRRSQGIGDVRLRGGTDAQVSPFEQGPRSSVRRRCRGADAVVLKVALIQQSFADSEACESVTGGFGVLLPKFMPNGTSTPGFKNGSVHALSPGTLTHCCGWGTPHTSDHPSGRPSLPGGLWSSARGCRGEQDRKSSEELAPVQHAAWPGAFGRQVAAC